MTSLKDKIQNALDENRMLVLGAEVLVGFEFTAFFQDGFKSLPERSQMLNLVGLAFMLFTLVLLLAPGVFHQLVEKGSTLRMSTASRQPLLKWHFFPLLWGWVRLYTSLRSVSTVRLVE